LAQFRLLFPPPKILREGRYKVYQVPRPPELKSKKEYSKENIEKKKLEEEKDGDRTIIGNLMWHAVDPQTGLKFSPNDLLANANIFVYTLDMRWAYMYRTASSDTTATALTFITYHLMANRECWDRLCEEIRPLFNSAEEITHAAIATLPYLNAIIHEGSSSVTPS
jgi:cytochrome P450